MQEASVRGLDGLTLGVLAEQVPLNKSGIAGLFGNKEGLQLAAVDHARTLFLDTVVVPARAASPGLARVWALVQRWIDYSRGRTFVGGCFFRAVEVELDGREGPVRDAVVAARRDWDGYLQHHVGLAVAAGELDPGTDAAQLVFEVTALLGAANDRSLLLGDDAVYARAEAAVRAALVARGADPGAVA
ncbi:hypothetical protein L600_000600000490 [Isoptericola variabilis J7]|nr:hypothetical protein L600_000600000490 [Isoptericola variabilis J7]